jgi:hypothetical protein
MARDCLFFSEDIFGGQFCIRSGGIYAFDPETGRLEFMSANLEDWAEAILDDFEVLTGYHLAHAWQEAHGHLEVGKRLVPITPFVAGGEFAIQNLHPLEAVKSMRLRANLARQIRDLPDGASISWKITD